MREREAGIETETGPPATECLPLLQALPPETVEVIMPVVDLQAEGHEEGGGVVVEVVGSLHPPMDLKKGKVSTLAHRVLQKLG